MSSLPAEGERPVSSTMTLAHLSSCGIPLLVLLDRLHWGIAYLAAGKRASAFRAWKRVLVLEPSHTRAKTYLAKYSDPRR